MLTLEKLKEMDPHEVIDKGEIIDNSDGINVSNSGRMLKWVAVRGGIHDWTIYCGTEDHSYEGIRKFGNKITEEQNIQKLVPCDEEAFKMYRL